jgi:hypothetical protein
MSNQNPQSSDGGVSTIIPYKNPKALAAYYLAVFSLIPCLGGLLGLAALILGFLGLSAASAHPEAKGKAHAWVGILLGGLTFFVNTIVIIVLMLK